MVAALSYQVLTFNLAAAKVRRVSHNGRSYLVAPASLIVPGVLNGSDGPGYYPADETSRNVASWDDMPIVVYHPTKDGQAIAAQDPQHREHVGKSTVGFLKNTRYADKLTSEAWFDEQQVQNYDAQLPQWAKMLPRLTSNTPIELSTGLRVDRDETPGVCPKTGRAYNWVARNHRPDHLAVLPDQNGACSVADGCGVVMNTENSKEESEGKWVTLPNGVHVQVKDGEIVKGPKVGKKEGGEGHTHESVTKRVDDLVKRIHASGEKGGRNPKRAEESKSHLAEGEKIEADLKTVTLKMSKTELAAAIGVPRAAGSWSKGKLEDAVQKNLRDRIGTAFRVHNTENSGKFGNPQHLETGKFQPHGSGTGKGDVHAAAVEGHKKCECGGKCDDCKKNQLDQGSGKDQAVTNGDTTMATTKLPEAERQGLINKIVVNCKCEGGDDVAVINSLSDAALMQLNAMSQASSTDDSSVVDEEDASPKGKLAPKGKIPPQFSKNVSAKEWLEAAPPEIRSAVTNSLKIERAARQQLIGKLVANVAKEQRAKYETFLSNKNLDELETLVEMIPSVVANRETDSLFGPVFLGAAGGHEGDNGHTRNQDQMTFNADADPEMDPQYSARQTAKGVTRNT